jgi:hypothetical protein
MYKNYGKDNFHLETIELARMIMSKDSGFKLQGMNAYKTDRKLNEMDYNFVRKMAADFMGYEFNEVDFPEINHHLLNNTDDVYDHWIAFCKQKGLNSLEMQQAGWEMIFGGEFNYIPSLQKFY